MSAYLEALSALVLAKKLRIMWQSRVDLARYALRRCQRDALRRHPAEQQAAERAAYCQAASANLQEQERELATARQTEEAATQLVETYSNPPSGP